MAGTRGPCGRWHLEMLEQGQVHNTAGPSEGLGRGPLMARNWSLVARVCRVWSSFLEGEASVSHPRPPGLLYIT